MFFSLEIVVVELDMSMFKFKFVKINNHFYGVFVWRGIRTCFFAFLSSTKSAFVPTRIIGTLSAYFLISGIHL